MESTVLIVDDDPAAVEFLKTVISHSSRVPRYRVSTANSGFRAEQACRTQQPAVVLLDLMLPDADGIDVLRALKAIDQGLEVIVISGQGTIKRALEAGQAGAFFFIEKSDLDPKGLLGLLDRAADLVEERRQHLWLQERMREQYSFENILGKSKPMLSLFELVDAVAASDANVLIQGENGTGKELFANAIHHRSHRAQGPFIKINCAALPKDLIESELFGYKKGSFTGATTDKVGLLELARGGSLMLDEIGEMPALLQTKLLRVLQEREFRPIGSDRFVQVDFRLICATNVDLEAALADGRLREDLYFRINTITMRVPPLRERAEDIPLLCSSFFQKFNTPVPQDAEGHFAGGVSAADPLPLAGQRARAGERHRAVGAGGQGHGDPAAGPAGVDSRGGGRDQLLGASPPHPGRNRAADHPPDPAAHQLEQAGGREHPGPVSADPLQQDAPARHQRPALARRCG